MHGYAAGSTESKQGPEGRVRETTRYLNSVAPNSFALVFAPRTGRSLDLSLRPFTYRGGFFFSFPRGAILSGDPRVCMRNTVRTGLSRLTGSGKTVAGQRGAIPADPGRGAQLIRGSGSCLDGARLQIR